MSQQIDREGNFQAEILEYELKEYGTGSVAIGVRCRITAEWNDEQGVWTDWTPYDVEASGNLFIVKKNGELNKKAIESLVQATGWDGSFNSIVNRTWQPTPCQLVIQSNTYNNVTTFQIAFVNLFDSSPGGGITKVDADKAKQMEARFGSQLRALAGNVKRNAPAATDKPMPTPAKPNGTWKPPTATTGPAAVAKVKDDSIPF